MPTIHYFKPTVLTHLPKNTIELTGFLLTAYNNIENPELRGPD